MKKALYITKEKKKELEKDLKELVNIKRKEIADKLDWYRDNAEDNDEESAYSEVLEEKELLEHQISELENMLTTAKIIEHVSTNKVSIGSCVKIKSGNLEHEYLIVSKVEADPTENKISNESPIGKKLLGKKVGDEFEVDTPAGKKTYKILSIK